MLYIPMQSTKCTSSCQFHSLTLIHFFYVDLHRSPPPRTSIPGNTAVDYGIHKSSDKYSSILLEPGVVPGIIDDDFLPNLHDPGWGVRKYICRESVILYKNGSEYVGESLNGVPHGQGKLQYLDGSVYVGHFENGKRQGRGQMTYSSDFT